MIWFRLHEQKNLPRSEKGELRQQTDNLPLIRLFCEICDLNSPERTLRKRSVRSVRWRADETRGRRAAAGDSPLPPCCSLALSRNHNLTHPAWDQRGGHGEPHGSGCQPVFTSPWGNFLLQIFTSQHSNPEHGSVQAADSSDPTEEEEEEEEEEDASGL